MLVISHVANKFKRFQQLLRRMYETVAVIEAPPPVVDMKSHVQANETLHSAEVALDVEEYLESTKLAPLKKHTSAVRLRDASKNDKEKKENESNAKKHAEVWY